MPVAFEHFFAYAAVGTVGFGMVFFHQAASCCCTLFGLAIVMELLQLWVPGQASDPNVALISGLDGDLGILFAAGLTAPSLRRVFVGYRGSKTNEARSALRF